MQQFQPNLYFSLHNFFLVYKKKLNIKRCLIDIQKGVRNSRRIADRTRVHVGRTRRCRRAAVPPTEPKSAYTAHSVRRSRARRSQRRRCMCLMRSARCMDPRYVNAPVTRRASSEVYRMAISGRLLIRFSNIDSVRLSGVKGSKKNRRCFLIYALITFSSRRHFWDATITFTLARKDTI